MSLCRSREHLHVHVSLSTRLSCVIPIRFFIIYFVLFD